MKIIEYYDLKRKLEKSYWIVPASIRFETNLDEAVKVFYCSLFALSNNTGKLTFTNLIISDAVNLPVRTVNRYLDILKQKKFLKTSRSNGVRTIELLKINDSPSKSQSAEETSLYAVVPGKVAVNELLNGLEKMLYAEILALTRAVGFCFASNETIASILKIDMRKFYRALKNLIDLKFIQKGYSDDGRKILLVKYSNIPEHKCIKVNQLKPSKKKTIKEADNNPYQTINKVIKETKPLDPKTNEKLERLFNSL